MQAVPSVAVRTFSTSKPSVLGSLVFSFSTAGESAVIAGSAARATVARASARGRAAAKRYDVFMVSLREWAHHLSSRRAKPRVSQKAPRRVVGRLQVLLDAALGPHQSALAHLRFQA